MFASGRPPAPAKTPLTRRLAATCLIAVVMPMAGLACDDDRAEQLAAKRKECNALIQRLNESAPRLKELTGKGETADPSEHAAAADARFELAKLYDQVSARVGDFHTQDAPLAELASRYRELAREAAEKARAAGRALKAEDVEKANAAQTTFNDVVRRENALMGEITGYCAH